MKPLICESELPRKQTESSDRQLLTLAVVQLRQRDYPTSPHHLIFPEARRVARLTCTQWNLRILKVCPTGL